MAAEALRILVVDDEPHALGELEWLLGQDERVGEVRCAGDAAAALAALDEADAVDAVLCDITMPGMDGIALARVLGRFARPPAVVFVTAHPAHAVTAFEVQAVDYVLKPVRAERLREAIRKVAATRRNAAPAATTSEDEQIAVETGRTTTFLARSDVLYATAQGDYARLHTATGSHLVRTSLAALEERWAEHGFLRIHRSTLVSLAAVTALTMEPGRGVIARVGEAELTVSRRQTRELREALLTARRG